MAIARDTLQKVSLRFPDSEVLFDYEFLDNPDLRGFEQLYSGHYEVPIGWDRKGMWLGLENERNKITTAIKRNTYYDRFDRVKLETWVSLVQWYGPNNIRGFDIGVDQCDDNGVRRYFSLRRVFTGPQGVYQKTNRWDARTGGELGLATPSFTILPGHGENSGLVLDGTVSEPIDTECDWPTWTSNENKRNTMYIALEYDPIRGCYLGFRFGDYKLGTLRDSGEEDPVISALIGQESKLDRFSNGLNTAFDLRAQTGGGSADATGADLYVERVRLSGRKTAE